MKKLLIQFLKFALVGGTAFLIDTGIYVGLTALFGEELHLVFNIISFSVSVIYNYILSMRFVFKGREDMSRAAEMIIFIILSVIGLGINELVVWALIDKLGIELAVQSMLTSVSADTARALAGIAAKIVATFIVLIWNFVSRKIFLEEHGSKKES